MEDFSLPSVARFEDGGLPSSEGHPDSSQHGRFGAPGRGLSTGSSSRKKHIKATVPKDGSLPGIKITTVMDIYKQIRLLTGMIGNVWGWTNATTTLFRQCLPGLARVHVGSEVYVMQGYLLQDLEAITMGSTSSTGSSYLAHTTITDSTVQDVTLRHPTPYFHHVLLLIKLRWLLRLHSACCELDYKMCSFRHLILGLQHVVLQQHEESECDNIFENKQKGQTGSHMNLESVLDDVADQLQRVLGGGWRGFLEYVATCDPSRSVHTSKMDSRLTAPKVMSNDGLAVILDTVFLTNFLRQSKKQGGPRLGQLYDDLEALGVALPEVPALGGAKTLRAWAKAQTKPTRQDRDRVSGKEHEKLAQLDAVLLTAAVEMHLPEVMASPEDIAEATANAGTSGDFDSAPEPVDFGSTGKAPGSAGPPAARLILVDKPQLAPDIFQAAVDCIHHHLTFPDGIRERLYALLTEEYGLSAIQQQRLAIAATQNIEGKRLPESTLISMEHREKRRLRDYSVTTYKDTSHLLVPSLVMAPIEKGKPAEYTQSRPVPERPPFASAFSSVDMTRSLPDLRGFTAKNSRGRDHFKVPLLTGPLTMDPDLGKLRTTGFFIKMPPLDPDP